MKQLLIIGFVWPEPNSSGAGTRMLQLIHFFRKNNWKIVFASAAADSEFMFDLTSLGVEKVSIAINDAAFDDFVRTLNPALVLFDRFMVEEQFGWRVAEHCPNAVRMLDTIDLHSLRLARQKASKEQAKFEMEDLYSDTAKREIASVLRCDISLIISEVEIEILEKYYKVDRAILYYLPFLVDAIDEETTKQWLPFEERKDFIFIGNFLHEPNWNAVQYLKQAIWPMISKKLPDASLQIYGAYTSQKVLQLHNVKERFMVFGRAKDAFDVVSKARVALAPLRFGAGAKGKLIEAMQCGTPSVTTSIGAESMQGDLPWSGIIADEVDEMVKAAITLYSDKEIWNEAQRGGITIVNQRYEKSLFESDFRTNINSVQQRLKQHRNNNFMGAILMHHTTASTKYMSRWIEAKNK